MTSGQYERQGQRRRKSRKRKSGSLLTHSAFAPILGLWGAALGGLAVMVLPPALIAGMTVRAGLTAWATLAQPVMAGAAALVLGGTLFAFAAAITRRARRRAQAPSIIEVAARRVRPIDPARDLGSRSLDDPLESMPFATPAWRDTGAPPAPAPAPEATRAEREPGPAPEADLPAPRVLDLAEFAEWPGRNAVWVEDSPAAGAAAPAQPAPAPVAYAPVSPLRAPAPPADPSAAALARLRAVPPSELSLAEMVERFAGALHEHRSVAPGKTLAPQDLAAREAALAEALKALSALSGNAGTPAEGEPLRAALARLQGLRGAA